MSDGILAGILAGTYDHRLDAFRPLPEGGERAVWLDQPCALSRSAMVNAPAPPDTSGVLPEARYRLTLYTRPEVLLELGDRAEVRDGSGRTFLGRTSDSFYYPSHCVTVLEVTEVEVPLVPPPPGREGSLLCSPSCPRGDGEPEAETAGPLDGQDSRETGPVPEEGRV